MRFPVLMRAPILAFGLTTAQAADLPDTGQSLCDNGAHVLVACTSANTGDTATYPRQDGRFGRDAAATAGTLIKVGGGAAGFDYTKVANNGNDLPVSATLGINPTDWACTRDNITALTWEVKVNDPTQLRHWAWEYTWYNSDASTNAGNAGSTGGNTCNVTLPSNLCNTEAFVTAVNAAALCTYNDWRMPTQRELLTLVNAGTWNPTIDPTYFPNTSNGGYWSAPSDVSYALSEYAMFVGFLNGISDSNDKALINQVRLVRGAMF